MLCRNGPTFAGKSHTQAKKSSTGPRDLANSSQCRREFGHHTEDLLNERDLGGITRTHQYARQLKSGPSWVSGCGKSWCTLICPLARSRVGLVRQH